MKLLKFILASILLISLGASGQTFLPRTNGTFTPTDPRLNVPWNLYIPRVSDTTNALNGGKDTLGALVYDWFNNKVWIRDTIPGGHRWLEMITSVHDIHPVNWCNIKEAGADTTGIIDASAIVQSKINSGCKVIYFPKGKYLLNNTVQLTDSITIIGDGKSSVIQINKNIKGFRSGSTAGQWATFLNFTISGVKDSASQEGIRLDTCRGAYLNNVYFFKIGGYGVHAFRDKVSTEASTILGCYADSCKVAFYADIAEFNKITGNTIAYCDTGLKINSGNVIAHNNNITKGSVGVYLSGYAAVPPGDFNDAHTEMTDNLIAHNFFAGLICDGVTNGQQIGHNIIRNNTVYDVYAQNSDNLWFDNNDLGVDSLVFINCTNTNLYNNKIWNVNTGRPGPPDQFPRWRTVGQAPTITGSGYVQNGFSIYDVINNKTFSIAHTNNIVDLTTTNLGLVRIPDTLITPVLYGSQTAGASLKLGATTNSNKTGSYIYLSDSTVYDVANMRLGINNRAPVYPIDIIKQSGTLLAPNALNRGATSLSGFRFTNDAGAVFQAFIGGSGSAPFAPNGGVMIDGQNYLGIVSELGQISFGKSTTLNGSNEHGRITNSGHWLFGSTADNGHKIQITGAVTQAKDSLPWLTSLRAGQNLLVHDSSDLLYKKIPFGILGPAASWCTVTGVDTTGTTDVSSTVQGLINSGCKTIYFPHGNYLLNSTIQLKDSIMIIGDGNATVLKTTQNQPVLQGLWSLGGSYCSFLNFSIKGNYNQDTTAGATAQDGILLDSCLGNYINNIHIYGVSGYGVHFKHTGYAYAAIANEATSNFIDSSYGGIMADVRAEFNDINHNTCHSVHIAYYKAGGNNTIQSNKVTEADYGIMIVGGTNNGHNVISGNTVAHSRVTGLFLSGVSNGENIIGNIIRNNIKSEVYMESCDNIHLTGNDIGGNSDSIIVVNCTNTVFQQNNYWGYTGSTKSPEYMYWRIVGDSVTVTGSGYTKNAFSVYDAIDNKKFDIKHVNNIVDLITTNLGKIRTPDTLVSPVIIGSETYNGALKIAGSSITTIKNAGAILIGNQFALRDSINTANDPFFGIGTTVYNGFHLDMRMKYKGAVALNIQNDSSSTSSSAQLRFGTTVHTSFIMHTDAAFTLFGQKADCFHIWSNGGTGGMRLTATAGDIEFGGSVINNTPTYGTFKLTSGNFILRPGTDNGHTLQVGGAMTINKDSVPIITSTSSQFNLVIDTASANPGLVERVPITTASATLDFPSTSAQSSSDLTITLTGAVDGDLIVLGVPNGSTLANSSFSAWVSSANTVTVRFNNYSSGAQDPASGTFKVRAIK